MLIYPQQTFLLLLKGVLNNNKMIFCYPDNNKSVTRSMFVHIHSDFRGVS